MSSVEDWESPRPTAIPWLLFSGLTPPELSRALLAGLGQGWLLETGVTVTSASQAVGKYRVCVMQLGSVISAGLFLMLRYHHPFVGGKHPREAERIQN